MVVGFGVVTMAAVGMATILTWNENTEGMRVFRNQLYLAFNGFTVGCSDFQ
jgi:hypothetical protein